MRNITVYERQSIWDIAIQEAGSINAVFDIARLNGLDINEPLTAGQILNVDVSVIDQDVVTFFRKKKLRPVNGTVEDEQTPFNTGFNTGFGNNSAYTNGFSNGFF